MVFPLLVQEVMPVEHCRVVATHNACGPGGAASLKTALPDTASFWYAASHNTRPHEANVENYLESRTEILNGEKQEIFNKITVNSLFFFFLQVVQTFLIDFNNIWF